MYTQTFSWFAPQSNILFAIYLDVEISDSGINDDLHIQLAEIDAKRGFHDAGIFKMLASFHIFKRHWFASKTFIKYNHETGTRGYNQVLA